LTISDDEKKFWLPDDELTSEEFKGVDDAEGIILENEQFDAELSQEIAIFPIC
jgi:hypothetical protein